MDNLKEIARASVKAQLDKKGLHEAVVAEPKKYKASSELLSQKSIAAHYDLYKGYTETFNKVSARLDSVNRDDTSSSHGDFRSLKLDEVYNLNAIWLHELYFANCFDPNSEVFSNSTAYIRLQRDFGSFDAWQKDFMASALSCGDGWAVCGYNFFMKKFVNTMISHHSGDVMVGLYPVLVVDMWAHSYAKDYLNDKESYLVAMMREFNWNVIDERFDRVVKIEEAMK